MASFPVGSVGRSRVSVGTVGRGRISVVGRAARQECSLPGGPAGYWSILSLTSACTVDHALSLDVPCCSMSSSPLSVMYVFTWPS